MTITDLFGIDLPVIQAPMAGAQRRAMAIAVSSAGGLGSGGVAVIVSHGTTRASVVMR